MPIVRADTRIPLSCVLPPHEISAKRPVNTLNGFTRKYMSQYLIHSHTPSGKKYILDCQHSGFRVHFTQKCTPQQMWLISKPHGRQDLLRWIFLIFTCDGVKKSMDYVANLQNIMSTTDKIRQQWDAYCPLANCACFGDHQMTVLVGGGGPQVNKFEQISSYGYQMSLAGDGVDVWCLGA